MSEQGKPGTSPGHSEKGPHDGGPFPFLVSGPSTHVSALMARDSRGRLEPHYFPSRVTPLGMLVDVRLFPPHGSSTARECLIFRPDALLRDGFDPALVRAAGESTPPGFVLMLASAPASAPHAPAHA